MVKRTLEKKKRKNFLSPQKVTRLAELIPVHKAHLHPLYYLGDCVAGSMGSGANPGDSMDLGSNLDLSPWGLPELQLLHL